MGIGVAGLQRLAGRFRRRIELPADLGEEGGEIGLVRSAGDDGERLALRPSGVRSIGVGVAADDEAARPAHVDVGEIEFLARRRGDREAGDDRVGVALPDGVRACRPIPAPGWCSGSSSSSQIARDEVDIEAGQLAVGVEEVERREIVGGDEADRRDRAGGRPLDAAFGIPEAGNDGVGRLGLGDQERREAPARLQSAVGIPATLTQIREETVPQWSRFSPLNVCRDDFSLPAWVVLR